MQKRGNLFSQSPVGACLAYRKVRDAANEKCESVRAQCEDLWSDFAEYADKNFPEEFSKHFHQRWFEMYLTVSLVRADLKVECRKPGPDVFADVDGQRIWIEAVCATSGQDDNPNSVPQLEIGKVQDVPIRKYVTRIRNSLDVKARKFKKYTEMGIVDHGDFTVIAINGAEITGLGEILYECMIRSLYGVGNLVVTKTKESGRSAKVVRESVCTISKTPTAKIRVRPFTNRSMANVSCALASPVNAFNLPATLGGDFVLYPNLSCKHRWIGNLLPVAKEWSFRETEEGWFGEKIDRV